MGGGDHPDGAAVPDHDVDVGRGLQILANDYGGTNDGNGIVALFAPRSG